MKHLVGERINRQRGSTLVAAVFFALVLAISGVTYLLVLRNAGAQEQVARIDNQALYAAESGLLLGTRMLNQKGMSDSSSRWLVPQDDRLYVNGLYVDVEEVDFSSSSGFWFSSSSGSGRMKIVHSRAYKTSTGNQDFVKRVSWVVAEMAGFEYGYFSNGLSNNGEGELCGNRFFGSAYITAKSSDNPINPVCNHTFCSKYYGSLDLSGTHINLGGNHCNFNGSHVLNGETPLYELLQSPVLVPTEYQQMAANIRASAAPKINLTGTGTLVFNDNGTATFNGTTYSPLNGVIFVANSDINVQGVVNGEATVVSGSNKKITINGDLTYKTLSSSGASAPSPPTVISNGSTDYLGIVSDGGVEIVNNTPRNISAAIVAWRNSGSGITRTSTSNKITITGSVLQNQGSQDFYPMDFIHDLRLQTHAPPGFPPLGMVNNLYKYAITNWNESSVY